MVEKMNEMKQNRKILKVTEVLPMSKETKERLAIVASEIKDKELFPEKVARAKKVLNNLKSLPL